jgi:predicted nucleic acid-binding protein
VSFVALAEHLDEPLGTKDRALLGAAAARAGLDIDAIRLA